MAAGFYVKRGEKEQGPFSSQELKKFAASGKLRKTDKIRKQDSKQYVPAEKVKGLFSGEAAPKKRRPPRKTEDEYGSVEVIEESSSASDFDVDDDEMDYGDVDEFDEYGVIEEYADNVEEYEDDVEENLEEYEPEPQRKRKSASRGGSSPARRGKSSRKKGGSAGKPGKKRKPAKKKSKEDDDDEDEDGPWASLFYGVVCIAAGIFLFIALGEGSPDDWGRRGGLIKLVVQLLYYVGGKWAVLVIMTLFGLVLFWSAFEKFKEQ